MYHQPDQIAKALTRTAFEIVLPPSVLLL